MITPNFHCMSQTLFQEFTCIILFNLETQNYTCLFLYTFQLPVFFLKCIYHNGYLNIYGAICRLKG